MGRSIVRTAALAVAIAALGASTAQAFSDPSPAGSNNFGCRPPAAHPRPVVLVHGLGATQAENWGYMAPRLQQAGYCVFSLTYGVDSRWSWFPIVPGGTIPMEQSSHELATFVDRVLAATGAEKVDLVGHSEGTVMPRYYLERLGGASKVLNFVALTPLWRGTDIAAAAELRDFGAPLGLSSLVINLVASFCGSCPEFLKGSPYLNALNADGEAVPGIIHTNIMARYDELVVPYTSGAMKDGGTNIVVQDVCPTHLDEHVAVAFDPAVLTMILNALDPGNKKPVTC